MNRRVLDIVSVNAINECGDDSLKNQIFDTFGAGTLVKDAKTSIVRFEKSMFGLKKTTISGTIHKLAAELMPTTNECEIVDSSGVIHSVSKEAVALLKAMVVYATSCPESIANCINSLLTEIDTILKNGSSEELVTVTVESNSDGDYSSSSNENLLNCCRQEIFGLLREAGVNIG